MSVPDAATLAETVRRELFIARERAHRRFLSLAPVDDAIRALDALAAALEQAQAERDQWKRSGRAIEVVLDDARDERDAALARIEQLEAALTQIADPSYVGNYDDQTVINIYRTWAANARAALAGGSGSGE